MSDPVKIGASPKPDALPRRSRRPTVPDIDYAAKVFDFVRCPHCGRTASLAAALEARKIPDCCGEPMQYRLHASPAVSREALA